MKKKPVANKDHQQRVKTPDLTSLKKKSTKTKKITERTNINISTITPNNLKKSILKQSTNASIKTETKPPKKTKIVSNKEKKEDQKVSNPTLDLQKERPNSASKKLFKSKNSKKEKENAQKKNNEVMNKTGDNFYKPKTQIKKSVNFNNNIDKQRKKSVSNKIKRQNINKTADTKKVKNHKKTNKKEKEKENEIKNIGVVNEKSIERKETIDESKKIVEKKEAEKDNKNNEIKENKKVENNIKKEENVLKEEKKPEIKNEEKKKEIKKEEKKPEIKKEEKTETKIEEKTEIKKEQIKEKKEEKKPEEIKKEDKKDEKKEEKKDEQKKEEKNTENKEIKTEDKTKPHKLIKYTLTISKKFPSNYKECLYLGLNSGFFNPIQKLNLFINSKELYENLNKNKLILELIDYYNKLGNKNLKSKVNSEYDIEKINKSFNPCELSINSLNFIDKEEENKLMTELQHPLITDYFKLILILLNEKNNENKNIFEFVFKDLLEKYKTKNFKNLLLKNFVNSKIIIDDEQFNSIQKMVMIKPDLLSPSTLLRYNRVVAYSAFFLKDLFNYLNLKTDDGKYYYKLRTGLPKNDYEEKINKLKLLI